MLANKQELLEKLRLGEDTFLELKEVRFRGEKIAGPGQNELSDELAAFANSRGGVLLLGVRDSPREVVGIPLDRLDAVEGLIRHACEDSVKPSMAPIIERMTLPDGMGTERPIMRVDVARSLFVHQSAGGYFHRVGSSKRPVPPEHLARLFQQRSQSRLIRFDETPVVSASLADLDEGLWRRFITPRTIDQPEQVLAKLAMAARDDGGVWRPTVAGLLLASRVPQRYLTGAFIQAVCYAGTAIAPRHDSVYQRDARDITGPLDEQIRGACDFVRQNMRVSARKSLSGGREDLPQFDMLAVFEAVTNAVAHRDYSMGSGKVRLRLFDDRLEIYTPGMLPNTMTPESLPFRQATRNEVLTSLLARCPVDGEPGDSITTHRLHIMDRRGEGVPIILARSEELSGQLPEYRMVDESELLLTIYAANQSSAIT